VKVVVAVIYQYLSSFELGRTDIIIDHGDGR